MSYSQVGLLKKEGPFFGISFASEPVGSGTNHFVSTRADYFLLCHAIAKDKKTKKKPSETNKNFTERG